MSYIGRGIDQIDNISTLDNLSFNGSLQTFNLTQNSVAFVPVSADALQIQIDGVIQSGNYTVSGSTVTFDFVPSGSSVCNGIKHFGVGVLTTVSDGAVTSAKLGNNSVGITQLNVSDGSNGQALTTNGSGTLSFASVGADADNYFATSGLSNKDLGTGLHIKTGDSGASVGGNGDELVIEGSGASGLSILSANNDEGSIYFGDDGNGTMGAIVYAHGNNSMQFKTSDSERMRIDSYGEIFVGKTSNSFNADGGMWTDGGERISLTRSGNDEIALATNYINCNGKAAAFHYSGTIVGSITTTHAHASFNTSSDYRLKENKEDITDGIERLKKLKPYKFNWKNDPNEVKVKVDGFFAHEVSSVVPEAISGDKDAMAVKTKYTADDVETQGDNPSKKVGDAKTYSTTEINAQSIDHSKLVPLLTSALQEAITKIETLEARVQALENA
jgi:hypothetical protein